MPHGIISLPEPWQPIAKSIQKVIEEHEVVDGRAIRNKVSLQAEQSSFTCAAYAGMASDSTISGITQATPL